MAKTKVQDTPSVQAPMTAVARYDSLAGQRNVYLERARAAAKLTIPGLMPPQGSTGALKLYTPWQSVSARGVNNLTAKFMLALFPPGQSFFRLTMDDYVIDQLAQQAAQSGDDGDDARATFEAALAKVERAVMTRMEQQGIRLPMSEGIKQLIVCGNALLQVLPKGKMVIHNLDKYVVKRDPEGEVVEIVVMQMLSRMTLPERARQLVETAESATEKGDKASDNNIPLYTRITRRTRRGGTAQYWYVCQEIVGKTIPGTEGSYPLDKTPWLPLRWSAVSGEDYGRGFIEEYMGDISSLESLSQSTVQFAAAAAKILIFVNEAGTTSKKKIAKAASGSVVDGDAKDVTILQLEKFQDFKVAKETADGIEKRLEQAFMLNSSVQRDAERVTAEEIRFVAAELEQTQAGAYTILGQELSRPLVAVYMKQMQREGALPALPEKAVNPQIVTGLDALGRTADLQKLDLLLDGIEKYFGTPNSPIGQYVDVSDYIKRRGTALGMDTKGLVKTAAQVQAQTQQTQAQQLTEKLGPHAIKAAAQAQQASPQPAAPQGATK